MKIQKSILILLSFLLVGCSQEATEFIDTIIDIIHDVDPILEEHKQNLIYIEDLSNLEFSGSSYVVVNDGVPYFEELTTDEFEYYSNLDYLGRPQTAFANISLTTLPDEERGSIAGVKPVGWHTYNTKENWNQLLPDNTFYVYNRCHLIFSLAGENANELNLITGTRYLNMNMADFEDEVRNYVQKTGNHVYYRVTPVYKDEELIARGVLMEAQSIETDDVCFCVYLFNVQMLEDGTLLDIDYQTGEILN